jgi:NOL1/NOP2/fmu family ribosome biogenesis protein
VKGEGHFIAVMRKNGGSSAHFNKVKYPLDKNKLKDFYQFKENYLKRDLNGNIFPFGDNIYMLKENIDIKGLKVLRPGLHIGILKKNRFEPSHSLALYLKKDDFENSVSFSSHSDEIIRYLKGETLNFHGTKGWNLVLVDGYSIGWGKMSNGVLKNHYPKGLRWL